MKYIAYLITLLVLTFVAFFFTPFMVLFAKPRFGKINNNNGYAVEPRLPNWLSWFDTPDNSLLGDENWKDSHNGKYLSRVAWLYRNSLYGFKWGPIACKVDSHDLIEYSGDPRVNRNNGVTGTFKAKYGKYWQIKIVKKIFGDFGIMWNFGWQLDEFVGRDGGVALFQFSPRFVSIK